MKKSHLEIILVTILYLAALYIWTLPMQTNNMPFGDVDSSSHFAIGDYMYRTNRAPVEVPFYIYNRYGTQNDFKQGALWYSPQFWTNTGIVQVVAGDRILPVFLWIAVMCTAVILTSYFFVRSLFGMLPALSSSFLLIFSTRDYMIYLWGQWPQSISYAYVPLVLYCFYSYIQNKKSLYLYVMGVFLAIQFWFHAQGLIASLMVLIIYSLILSIKEKKIIFDFKHILIAIFIFIFVSYIFAPLNLPEFVLEMAGGSTGEGEKALGFSALFHWYPEASRAVGSLPDFYFHYNQAHGSVEGGLLSWWTLPFLFIGVFFLILKRDNKTLLFISWLVAFFILTHLSIFGLGARDIRMVALEAHLIYPTIAIGLISVSSLFKVDLRNYVRYSLVVLFLIAVLAVNAPPVIKIMKEMQSSIGRITPVQYEASNWMLGNLPEDSRLVDYGTLGGAKVKWLNVLAAKQFITDPDSKDVPTHLMIDYSDLIAIRNQEGIDQLQSLEQKFNATPVYNKNNIRVYQIG